MRRWRIVGGVWASLGLAACAAPRTVVAPAPAPEASPVPAASPAPAGAGRASPPVAVDRLPACDPEAARGKLSEPLAAAVDDFLARRRRRALLAAEAALEQRPDDRVAAVVAAAAAQQLRLDRDVATAHAGDGRAVALSAIPAWGPGEGPTPPRHDGAGPGWLRVESKRKNLVTDDARWLSEHGLSPVVHWGARAPGWVPHSLGGVPLGLRFVHGDHEVDVYGSLLAVTSPDAPARVYDASAMLRSGPVALEVTFAQRVGERLIVQAAYNGYAAQSDGHNAYLAAFDASTGALLWSSAPLVGGRANFVVAGDIVVSGYGFTREPDFLFAHALSTGEPLQRLALDSGPSALLVKGGLLHVRTYDRDYVIRVGAPLPEAAGDEAPQGVAPGASGASGASGDVATDCWARRALSAVESGDGPGLRAAFDAYVRGADVSVPLAAALADALARMETHTGDAVDGDGGDCGNDGDDTAGAPIDLQRGPPIVVGPVAFAREVRRADAPAGTRPPRLRQRSRERASPIRGPMHPPFDGGRPYYLPPVQEGRLPPGAPGWIPERYGVHGLRAVIPSGDRTLLVYGGRYLVSVHRGEAERILDLEALRHPPRADPAWEEFAVQDVTFAQVAGERVYVCNGGGSYARDVDGKKGFLTALDLATGEVLWRSQPLVCNSDFVLLGEYLVTGYGFTAEPDRLYVVRLGDGEVMQRLPLGSAPDELRMQDGRLVVECYGHRHVFELRAPRGTGGR